MARRVREADRPSPDSGTLTISTPSATRSWLCPRHRRRALDEAATTARSLPRTTLGGRTAERDEELAAEFVSTEAQSGDERKTEEGAD
ncbi:hypothetical protein C9J85_11075 [Haloferax sp. wsp5]|nr:hypothetical protein C9J85_11075 [Haloferax sp. wsp5]